MAKVLDGKALAAKMKEELAEKTKELSRKPGLAVILVGDNPASRVYVTSKRKDCEECGYYSEEYTLPAETPETDLLDLIEVLNGREEIDGILVQLPLPKHMDEKKVLLAIDPGKDVDGFHPMNVGKLVSGEEGFLPCTPSGVIELMEEYGVNPAGKHCVILGRSNIVGKPMALLMLRKDATVTVCHSKTPNLTEICQSADILIAAVGRRGLVTADMVKEGAVVIDVAINRDENGKLCGDCDKEIYEKASAFTPVPGGVGPMTRAVLMKNTYLAAKAHKA